MIFKWLLIFWERPKKILIDIYIMTYTMSILRDSISMHVFPFSSSTCPIPNSFPHIVQIYIYIYNLPNACKITEFLSLLFWQCLDNANINIRIVSIFIIWVLGKHILCFKTQNILKHFNIVNIHISILNIILWLFITVTILKSN